MISGDLSQSNFNIGMSTEGISYYVEDLRANVLEAAQKALVGDKLTEVKNKIRENWQGNSCDKFLADLDKAIAHISDDLEAEYADLIVRLEEIQNNYLKQDNELM